MRRILILYVPFFAAVSSLIPPSSAFAGPLRQAQGRPDHVVIGYSACWLDDVCPPEAYNYGALTHIARSFIRTTPEGHITVPDNYFNPELTRLAKAHGVKVIASIGGWVESSANWVSMATHPDYEKRFFDELEKLIGDNHFDGVDIDWEPGAQTDGERRAFTSFMKNLRARFPRWTLTTATMVGEQYASHMDWREISSYVDYVGLMTYDFAGIFSHYAYHHANLYSVPGSKAEKGISVDETVHRVMRKYGVAREKLLVGVPFYGKLFNVEAWNDPIQGEADVTGFSYSQAAFLKESGEFSEQWDEGAQAPYLKKKEGKGLLTYDDPKSMALKCDYVLKQKLPGILIWVLGSDLIGDRTPLLDTVALAFGSKGNPIPVDVLATMESASVDSARSSRDELEGLSQKLSQAGKIKEAGEAIPGPLPDLTLVGPQDRPKLVEHLKNLQVFLAATHRKMNVARKSLGIPAE